MVFISLYSTFAFNHQTIGIISYFSKTIVMFRQFLTLNVSDLFVIVYTKALKRTFLNFVFPCCEFHKGYFIVKTLA